MATRTSSAFTSSLVKPVTDVLPAFALVLLANLPSKFTLLALTTNARPDALAGKTAVAPEVFLSVNVLAVICTGCALAATLAAVSPAAKLPTIAAASTVKSSLLLPKLMAPNVSTLL